MINKIACFLIFLLPGVLLAQSQSIDKIVAIVGDMMRMPGLPAIPASEGMDIDNDGNITGLS